MSRSRIRFTGALVVAATLTLAACGSSATPVPELSDPADILVGTVQAVQAAKSVHIAVELDGEVPLDLGDLLGGGLGGGSGSGSGGGSFDLTGTTVDGDIDIEDQAARLTFTLPGLLNLQGEIIVVDGNAYVKASLLGDKYQKFEGSDAGGLVPLPSVDPSASLDPAQVEAEIREAIQGLATPPTKLADEACGDTTCYHVQVKLAEGDEGPIASLAPDITADGTLDVYVRKNDLRPSRLVLSGEASGSADGGSLTATITLSGWDAALDIQAPPADQVSEGDFSIPGLPD